MSVSGGEWRSEGGAWGQGGQGGQGGRGGRGAGGAGRGQGGGKGGGKGGGRGGGSSCPRAPPGGGRQKPAKEFFLNLYIEKFLKSERIQ